MIVVEFNYTYFINVFRPDDKGSNFIELLP